jgi:LuxR family maltose regulon positive regulatory protein
MDVLCSSTPDTMIRSTLCAARLHVRAGRQSAAEALLSEMESVFYGRGLSRGIAYVVGERHRMALRSGDRRHARMLQCQLDRLSCSESAEVCRDDEIAFVGALARARLALAEGCGESAQDAIALAREKAKSLNRDGLMVTADLLEARAFDLPGRRPEAIACLDSALTSASRLGLIQTMLDEVESIQDLLSDLQSSGGDCQAYLARLQEAAIAAGLPISDRVPERAESARPQARIRGLTPREQQVLDLLGQAMSNKRIALALNISELTVKWNLKQIFSKLGVSRRYDAIVAARKLVLHDGPAGTVGTPSLAGKQLRA